MSLVNSKKSFLALILAVLLVASMLPLFDYSASAATYYSATGVVTDATMNTITILKNGKYRTFAKTSAKIKDAPQGIAIKDTIKVVYDAANPKEAVQLVMVSPSSSAHRRPHDTHVLTDVTGVITDATMNAVTITTPTGTMMFGKGDAHLFNARDGIAIGDKIRITYYEDVPTEAVQIYMVERASNYGYTEPAPSTNNRFVGDIVATGDGYFVCQNAQTGILVTFYYDSVHYDGYLQEGDSVMVIFDLQYPSIATRVLPIDSSDYYR